MPKTILWNARPTGESLIAAAGTLKNLANNGIAISGECANGTGLFTHADFLLYAHDFAAAPSAGAYFELHIVYEMDAILADGEDGDLAGTPNLTAATLAGVFPIKASDEDQYVQLCGVPIGPHDFKVCIVNKTGQAIANTDGSTLAIYRYCAEVQ